MTLSPTLAGFVSLVDVGKVGKQSRQLSRFLNCAGIISPGLGSFVMVLFFLFWVFPFVPLSYNLSINKSIIFLFYLFFLFSRSFSALGLSFRYEKHKKPNKNSEQPTPKMVFKITLQTEHDTSKNWTLKWGFQKPYVPYKIIP